MRWNAQTRPRFILSSERVLGNGVRAHVTSKDLLYRRLRGGWNPRRCITQDSEPSALPTELFRPPGDRYSKLNLKLFSVASRKTVEADPLIR